MHKERSFRISAPLVLHTLPCLSACIPVLTQFSLYTLLKIHSPLSIISIMDSSSRVQSQFSSFLRATSTDASIDGANTANITVSSQDPVRRLNPRRPQPSASWKFVGVPSPQSMHWHILHKRNDKRYYSITTPPLRTPSCTSWEPLHLHSNMETRACFHTNSRIHTLTCGHTIVSVVAAFVNSFIHFTL